MPRHVTWQAPRQSESAVTSTAVKDHRVCRGECRGTYRHRNCGRCCGSCRDTNPSDTRGEFHGGYRDAHCCDTRGQGPRANATACAQVSWHCSVTGVATQTRACRGINSGTHADFVGHLPLVLSGCVVARRGVPWALSRCHEPCRGACGGRCLGSCDTTRCGMVLGVSPHVAIRAA